MGSLLPQIETYVRSLFEQQARPELTYHTFEHTLGVVEAARELAHYYQLTNEQQFVVLTAAWFHDSGYLLGVPSQHEEKGAEAAREFLQKNKVAEDFIQRIEGCILATKMPQSPRNMLEQIVCDSDLYHLGNPDYKDTTKLLRKERELTTGQAISGADWREGNIKFLSQHRYFTDYAKNKQGPGQAANLQRLLDKQEEKVNDISAPKESPKKDKSNKPERGIETMFRTTSTNHLRLSEIADSKANIMISVNSIMVSVIVSVLSHRLEQHPELILPTTIFLVTALLTIIFAVLATRPNITQGTFSRADIENRRVNLLFFGNFYNMKLEDYEHGVEAMMNDSTFLYSSMTRDIYYLGVVLGKKYKLLRIAYTIFMFGFIVSILAFLTVFILTDEK
ncbi:MAG: DUF5706 domain-containing protein [Siphonobacter sp.]